MDFLTLGGLFLAIIAIAVGNLLEGGQTAWLIQATAFLIVIGGTLGAVLIQTPRSVFVHSMKMTRWVLFPPTLDAERMTSRIVRLAQIARRDGARGLQKISNDEEDPFARKGLSMVLEGGSPEVIRSVLETDLALLEQRDMRAARVFDGLAGYAPTLGILGAVLGLIHVMHNLSTPSAIGPGIAVAFVATLYGVVFANIFFLPVANKLKALIEAQSEFREMVITGFVAVADGEGPKDVAVRLDTFCSACGSQRA